MSVCIIDTIEVHHLLLFFLYNEHEYCWIVYDYTCLQVNVYKDPITDAGKKSKKGQMTLEIHDDKFETKTEGSGDPKNVS